MYNEVKQSCVISHAVIIRNHIHLRDVNYEY